MKRLLAVLLVVACLVGCSRSLVVYGSTPWYNKHTRSINEDYQNNVISYEEYVAAMDLAKDIHAQWLLNEEKKRNKVKRKRFLFF